MLSTASLHGLVVRVPPVPQDLFPHFLIGTLPRSLLSSTPKSDEVTVTASFGGDVKPSVLGDRVFISLRLFAGLCQPQTWGKPKREHKKYK